MSILTFRYSYKRNRFISRRVLYYGNSNISNDRKNIPFKPPSTLPQEAAMPDYTHEMISPLPQLPVYFNVYEDTSSLVPSHWHEHIEILMILEGAQHINIHEQEYTLAKNDMLVINSSDIHSTRVSGYAKILLLQIPWHYLDQHIHSFLEVRFQEYFCYGILRENPAYLDMLKQLRALADLFSARQDGYELAFNARLHDFLHTLYLHFSERIPAGSKGQKNTARLRETLSFIEQHYKEPVTMRQAAALAALNPEYFCRIFKKNTGITFLEYVNQVRLTHIYEELISTEDTVTDILARNGFSNYKIFSRMFRDTYGGTPTQIRRSHAPDRPPGR